METRDTENLQPDLNRILFYLFQWNRTRSYYEGDRLTDG